MKAVVLRSILVLAASALFSAAEAAGQGWTTQFQILEINQQQTTSLASDQLIVSTTGLSGNNVSSNPSACGNPNSFYFTIGTEKQKRLLAMLLSAQMSGRNISVWTTGNCQVWGASEIDGVLIR